MNNSTNIPFLDLVTPHRELENQLTEVCRKAFRTAGFIGGPMVEDFEKSFAAFCGSKHAVGVNSGTDALRFALIACGVRHGDVVVTVPHTFIATTEAISQAGAAPEFVDIDERTYNMDPKKLEEYLQTQCSMDQCGKLISRRSRRPITAVVPVHLYGQVADMDPIVELAAKYGLMVIEDACQAHGAEYFSATRGYWIKAGSIGQAAAFSFYPGKNLGACGEGGAVTTNDLAIAQRVKMLRDHGQAAKYYHDIEGYNGRLDAIQAGLLHVKLRYLSTWNQQRRRCAEAYGELFGYTDAVMLPFEPPTCRAVYHLYVIRVENRQDLQNYLAAANIGTGIHYPIPLHLQKAYQSLGYAAGDFPVCEKVAAQILSLPMYPQLMREQQEHVVNRVLNYLSVNLQCV